ncbi:MAG: zinc-binding dehydrogenase [Clostridia bacterium]|nr:zinc-binding dehydrogenase [Clostridia bacterium]
MKANDFKTTRAVVIERPFEANVREIKLTEPMADAFVAKTTFSSISTGTDMKTYRGMQHPEQCWYPLVPGYETAGVIVAAPDAGVDLSRIPESARSLKVGDRVMINECRKYGDVCAAWGGGSEYTIKDSNTTNDQFDYMVKIPDNVTDQQAVLAYLACVPLKGIKRLTLRPKETIVVVGAGMVGISAIQELKILEPTLQVICIERNAFRRSIAENYADIVTSPENAVSVIYEATNGKMADQLMECSGNPEVVGTLHKYIKDGGWEDDDIPAHIHLQGDYPDRIIFDHYHRWFVKNATITMTCALRGGCKEQVLQWISEGKFDTSKLPYEVWGVSKAKEAFEHQLKAGADCFKILFDWSK